MDGAYPVFSCGGRLFLCVWGLLGRDGQEVRGEVAVWGRGGEVAKTHEGTSWAGEEQETHASQRKIAAWGSPKAARKRAGERLPTCPAAILPLTTKTVANKSPHMIKFLRK